ncbi:MAG: hypothetical protein RDV48_20010 [Candidatus Eremiobacteraeota bacterium]|nr:hypothetical protein [Candidatus Eremiobacteraeota bacterium]
MDDVKEIARKMVEKLARSTLLINRWKEGDKAQRSLDTPEQSRERKQREEDAHDARRAEEARESRERVRRRTLEAESEATQARQGAINTFFTIVITLFGIALVIWFVLWIFSLFKK